MNRIIQYFKNRKERQRLREDAQLKAEFRVVERGGYLWLTHNGVAFLKVADLAQAEDITKELNEARECAVEFERL